MVVERDVINVLSNFKKNGRHRKMASFFLSHAIDDIVHDYNNFNYYQDLKKFIFNLLERELKLYHINHGEEFEKNILKEMAKWRH